MVKRIHFAAITLLWLVTLLLCNRSPLAQSVKVNGSPSKLPSELTLDDSSIRSFVGPTEGSCKFANINEWPGRLRSALEMANSRSLIGDRALIESMLGSAEATRGRTDEAFVLFEKALQDSIDAKREVLQADILISLSSESEMKGNIGASLDLLSKGLSLSEKNGSLFEKTRALGEIARLEIQRGNTEKALALIDQALEIDRLNGYGFEARHLLYKSTYLSTVGNADRAVQSLTEARVKAIAAKDAIVFVQAEDAYAFIAAKKGNLDEALSQMESIKRNDLRKLVDDLPTRECFSSYLQLPLVRLIWLEGFASVLGVAKQNDKEVDVWQEVYSTSRELGLVAGEAEAKEKIANLESELKRSKEAIEDYKVAADLYRAVGNETGLDQIEVSESILLVNLGRGDEAIPLIGEIVDYAKQRALRELEFRADVTLASIHQRDGRLPEARDALERAVSLIRPGPFDEQIDNTAVHSAYVSLSDIYRKLQIATKEIVSIDRAFFVSFHLKDEEAEHREVAYLDQRLAELRIRELVEQEEKAGQLADSLILSYVLNLRDGSSGDLTQNHNWQRIISLPFQVVQRAGGDADLAQIFKEIGPLLGVEKLPLLNALARHYVSVGADPVLAEKYALEAENLVGGLKGTQSALKVECECVLAISYARQGKNLLAGKKSTECLDLAKDTRQEQTIVYSNAVNAIVQVQIGNVAAAKSSLEGLVSKSPDNPELLIELAVSLAGARLYDEADKQLSVAVSRLVLAKDKKGAARAYGRVSFVLSSDSSRSSTKLQLSYLRSELDIYHQLGSSADEAETLIALGDYFLRVEQTHAAIDQYEKARSLAQKVGQENIVAQSYLGAGNVYQTQKNYVRARVSFEEALRGFREASNTVGETNCLRNLGQDYYELNDSGKALAAFVEARKTAQSAGPIYSYLAAYFLGNFYLSQGEYEKALTSFHDALNVTTSDNDIEHSAHSHLALSRADSLVGDWQDSLDEAKSALQLFENVGDRQGQGFAWEQLTDIYADRTSSLQDFGKAEDSYRNATQLGSGKNTQLDLLEIYLQTGRYAEAVEMARRGIQDCVKEKDSDCRAHALISLSEADRLKGDLKDSRASLDRAASLVAKSSDVYLRGRLIYQKSRLLASEGKFDQALASYEELISLVENVKGRLGTQEQRSLSENYSFIYDEVVALLHTMGERSPQDELHLASRALAYAEENKARQFSETWGRVFRNQMALGLPASVREREQSLSSERDRLLSELKKTAEAGNSLSPAEVASVRSQLSAIQEQIQSFLVELRRTSPQYAAIAYPETVGVSNLPLHRGETLVEFKVTENATFVWIIQNVDGTKNQLRLFYEIPEKRAWLLHRVESIRSALNSLNPAAVDLKLCEELFGTIFPGAAAKVVLESPELIFIPDDVLFVLPFELYSPAASVGEFPLLKKPTTYYPSAVSFELARAAKLPSNWGGTFLAIANPITSPEDERFDLMKLQVPTEKRSASDVVVKNNDRDMPTMEGLKLRGFSFDPLPGTAREVESIASLIRGRKEVADVRMGVDATKRKLLDTDLAQFRFLHFATHGVLPVDGGIREPSLVLSINGLDSSDMFLSMSEILGLKLRSESVVLSACDTGAGKISRAEGVMSLGRAFLAAGAASVTVSLWKVSDDSTALFMNKYYEGLLQNKKKSVALAEARFAVFESGSRNPFFWAPFIVIGE